MKIGVDFMSGEDDYMGVSKLFLCRKSIGTDHSKINENLPWQGEFGPTGWNQAEES